MVSVVFADQPSPAMPVLSGPPPSNLGLATWSELQRAFGLADPRNLPWWWSPQRVLREFVLWKAHWPIEALGSTWVVEGPHIDGLTGGRPGIDSRIVLDLVSDADRPFSVRLTAACTVDAASTSKAVHDGERGEQQGAVETGTPVDPALVATILESLLMAETSSADFNP